MSNTSIDMDICISSSVAARDSGLPGVSLRHITPEDAGRDRCKEVVFFFAGCMLHRSDGCHTRALEVLDFLVSEDFKITVYSFVDHAQWPWTTKMMAEFRTAYPNVTLVCEPLTWAHKTWTSAKNFLVRFVPFVPSWAIGMPLPLVAPCWKALYKRRDELVFWVNYADGVTQLNGIGRERVFIDTHDLLFVARSQQKGWTPRSVAGLRFLRKELALLARAKRIFTINPAEQVFFSTMLGTEVEVTYLPPRLNIVPVVPPRALYSYADDLLFLGSDNAKNIRCLNTFLEEFLLWESQLCLVIAGRVSEHVKEAFRSNPRIKIVGYVSDLPALYRSVKAVICPVVGTGVNMKIIEAINHCKPVFASEGARAALSPEVRARSFPLTESVVTEVLTDPQRLRDSCSSVGELGTDSENNQIWKTLAHSLHSL
ncbi:MAG: glycosyltransferase [Acidobacteriota bacterium]|nr:glycosyltransferase [Acidobacteriota bacterium]